MPSHSPNDPASPHFRIAAARRIRHDDAHRLVGPGALRPEASGAACGHCRKNLQDAAACFDVMHVQVPVVSCRCEMLAAVRPVCSLISKMWLMSV